MKSESVVKSFEPLSESDKWLASQVVDSAISVHRYLGPGLDSKVYLACFEAEIKSRNIKIKGPLEVPVVYHGHTMDSGLPIDFLIEDSILVSLKTSPMGFEISEHYMLSCLKFSNKRLAYLLNFNHALMKDGVRRLIL